MVIKINEEIMKKQKESQVTINIRNRKFYEKMKKNGFVRVFFWVKKDMKSKIVNIVNSIRDKNEI